MNLQADLQAKIDKFGYTFIGVMSDAKNPGFTYSIGLSKLGMPELIMFGIRAEYAIVMMTSLIEDHRGNSTIPQPTTLATPITEYSNLPAHLIEAKLELAENYAFQAKYFAEDNTLPRKYMQWVWPDTEGRFPWEEDFTLKFRKAQPMLGEAPK